MTDPKEYAAYRIGWLSRSTLTPLHKRLRFPWQAETPYLRFARRGLTAKAAERKAYNDSAINRAYGNTTAALYQKYRYWRITKLGF